VKRLYSVAILTVLAAAGTLPAQQVREMPPVAAEPPVSVLRGILTRWNVEDNQLTIATRDRTPHQCSFDDDTFLTSRLGRLTPDQVETGSRVDAVLDSRLGEDHCVALTIYVLIVDRTLTPAQSRLEEQYQEALTRQRHVIDHLAPRGDQTFAGVVTEADSEHVVLRTRDGISELRLRRDTSFTDEGKPSDASMLEINARVFIRGGTGIDGRLEAYQVVRGEILMPN